MQRAKESHDLAATAAYDGLSSGDGLEGAYQWRCSGAIQRGVDAQNCTIRETASLMGTRSREGGMRRETRCSVIL
jgi:hypothetical protein